MRQSPLKTDLTFAWLRGIVLYRAAGMCGKPFFPYGELVVEIGVCSFNAGKGSILAAGNGSMILAEAPILDEDFGSPELLREYPSFFAVAYPILKVRTGMLEAYCFDIERERNVRLYTAKRVWLLWVESKRL